MKISWISLLLACSAAVSAHEEDEDVEVSALQFCAFNEVRKADLCLAVTSAKNSTTGKNDLSMHLSVVFVDRMGWASVGIGEKMAGSLMFFIYPGVADGDVTLSVRTIGNHFPPKETLETPEIEAETWVNSTTGLYNAQIVCYDCEAWPGSNFSATSAAQPWIWASNSFSKTSSDSTTLRVSKHSARGVAYLDMAASFLGEEKLVEAQVSDQRVSIPATAILDPHNSPSAPEKHHKHSLLGITSLHGMLLAFSFFTLSVGVIGIRSGLPKSFKLHWVIQAFGGTGIIVGCLMGIWISFKHGGKFGTIHQIVGLFILPTILLQSAFGYLHHLNFIRYHQRTSFSHYHILIGRTLLVLGNVNVCFGLSLGGASATKRSAYYAVILVQVLMLLPVWYFWLKQGKTVSDILGKTGKEKGELAGRDARYESVEQGESAEAFIIGGIGDEYEMDEDEERTAMRRSKEEHSEDEDGEDEFKERKQ